MNRTSRRLSYIFLCALPFLDLVVVGVRALRIPVFYGAVGAALSAAVVLAAGLLGARMIVSRPPSPRRLALSAGA